MSRLGRGLVISAVAGAVLYFLLAAALGDFRKVWVELGRYPPLPLLLGTALASLNYAFRFWRWQRYLAILAVPVPPLPSLGIFLSGFALTITPGKVGEVLKSYMIRTRYGTPMARTAPIVVAERLTDLIALLLLGLCGARSLMGPSQRWFTILGFLLCAGPLVVVSSRRLAHGAIDLAGRLLPARLREGLLPRLHEFYDATQQLLRPAPLLMGIGLSVLAWLCECVAFLVILRAFPGVQATLLVATFIYAMMTVAGALSFIPGGLGVTEAGMIALLVRLCAGTDESTAVAATVLVRLVTLWFAVALGLGALLVMRRVGKVSVDLDELRRDRGAR